MAIEIKNICCIGAGYVGGPTMAVISEMCPNIKITVVDLNKKKIKAWNSENLSDLPVYEKGLKNIVALRRNKNLFFSTDIQAGIEEADMIFLSVNTPTKQTGLGAGQASDLSYVEDSTRQIAKYAKNHTIIVEKSTIPVRTAETIKNILDSNQNSTTNLENKTSFSVLSNPEFLAEGTAINDLRNPDRVLIGGEEQEAIDSLKNIYSEWVDRSKILETNLWSAELAKLVANAFLAQRISSVNSISALCEKTGANITEVVNAIGMDSRIGEKFLNAGPGFGGSCFKKDILNLVYLCNYYGLTEAADYWYQVININDWQQKRISDLIVQKLFGTVKNKKIAILGFSFKANTNDTRESPAINICKNLMDDGATINIYDPKVNFEQIKSEMDNISNSSEKHKNKYFLSKSIIEAAENTDAIVIITEWDEFNSIDWKNISKLMRHPAWLIDARKIHKNNVNESNIKTWELGK
ncbi:nucleotide sugar dehydrogenase [Prochlorococcus sp. AH-716-M18]|nr:nucleotide sugar dehydrogenase [Prochlorococcus sp. AH-716-M18]